MKRRALLGTLALAALVIAVVAYFSARAGYRAAQLDAMFPAGGADAAYTASILERLNAGDTNMAHQMLETQLDGLLIERWVRDRRSSHIISVIRPEELDAVAQLYGVAAQYREAHPSSNPSPKVRADIQDVVARYKDLAPGPVASPNNRSRGP